MNHLEMPLANLFGHGDVKIHKPAEFITMAEKAGFTVLTMEKAERLPRTSCCAEMIYMFPRKSRITFT